MMAGVSAFWGRPTPELTEPGEGDRLTSITVDVPAAHLGLWVISEESKPHRLLVQLRGPRGSLWILGGGTAGGRSAFRVAAEFVDGAGEYRAVVLNAGTEEVIAEAPISIAFRR